MPSASPPPSTKPSVKPPGTGRRWALGCGIAVLVVLVLVGVGGFVAWRMAQSEPESWKQTQRMLESRSESDLERIASNTQNRLFTAIKNPQAVPDSARPQAVSLGDNPAASTAAELPEASLPSPPPGAHRIVVGVDEVNVWLHVGGLRKLLAHVGSDEDQWPPQVRGVVLATDGGTPRVMLEYDDGDYRQLITVGVNLQLNPDGTASLSLDSVYLGKLRTPASTLLNQVRAAVGDTIDPHAAAWLDRMIEGVTFDPEWELDDRRVRVVGLHTLDDRVVADLLPVPPK